MDEQWKFFGLCRTRPVKLVKDPPEVLTEKERLLWESWWFPSKKTDMPPEARNACADCPVAQQCESDWRRREGMSSSTSREGNQDGKTPKERASIVRREKKQREREERIALVDAIRPKMSTTCSCDCGRIVEVDAVDDEGLMPHAFATEQCTKRFLMRLGELKASQGERLTG